MHARARCEALKDLSNRYIVFGDELLEATDSRFKDVLNRARLTYTEARLFEALVQSNLDPSGASEIIGFLAKRFNKAEMEASQIEPFIWTQAQRVSKGQTVVQ